MVGHFQGAVDFGDSLLTSAGGTDIVVAKYDPSGSHVWSQRFGDASSQQAFDVATDPAGNIFVAGHFGGTVDFGGGAITCDCRAGTYIAKFDPMGNHVWSRGYCDDYFGSRGLRVATNAAGDVITTGIFEGWIDFGGGPLFSAGSTDIFLAKLDASGNHLWSQRYGDADWQTVNGFAVGPLGEILFAGEFPGTIEFGGGPLTCAGDFDIYLAKLDANGGHIWSTRFGDTIDETGDDVAVDGLGNVFLTGYIAGPVDFGGGPVTCAGESDVYLAKFGADGTHEWSRSFGDPGFQFVRSVDTDPHGNVLITGHFSDTMDFGGVPLVANQGDTYVAKLGPDGTHIYSERFGEEGNQYGNRLSVDGLGNVFLAGHFGGSIDFGGGLLVDAGGWDMYLAKFETTPTSNSNYSTSPVTALQAFPNPFNPTTTIAYSVPAFGTVTLSIYDVHGRLLRILVDEPKEKGRYAAEWDGQIEGGTEAGSGVYFVRMEAGRMSVCRKIVLVK
jgi:hypothetical protein